MINRMNASRWLFIALAICFVACDEDTGSQLQETAKSGTVTVYVDSLIADVVEQSINVFQKDKEHSKAKVVVTRVSATEAYDKLFAREAKLVITARGYTPREDTLMMDRKQAYPRTHIATDALVFYTSRSFPSDTLSDEDVRTWLSGGAVDLSKYPGLSVQPMFSAPVFAGSIVDNLSLIVLKGVPASPLRLRGASSFEAQRTLVLSNPNVIGVAYMSQIASDTTIKRLRIGFTDSKGERVYPQHVHPGYVRMGKYPYAVPIYAVLLERPHQFNLASGVAGYLYQNFEAQKVFLRAGILPEFIKLELTPQE